VSSTRDYEQPDDLSESTDESRDEPFFFGEDSDYSEAFVAALQRYRAGDLDGALAAFEALLAEQDDPVADPDVLSVASAALNRASILSLKGDIEAAIAAYDSAFRRFGHDRRVTTLAGLADAYAHGRDHRALLGRRLRNRRLAWPLAILIYGSCLLATIALKRRRGDGSR
jgi:tetratricopeptide (TPR) repeat protein